MNTHSANSVRQGHPFPHVLPMRRRAEIVNHLLTRRPDSNAATHTKKQSSEGHKDFTPKDAPFVKIRGCS
jgi:hypothetical protein